MKVFLPNRNDINVSELCVKHMTVCSSSMDITHRPGDESNVLSSNVLAKLFLSSIGDSFSSFHAQNMKIDDFELSSKHADFLRRCTPLFCLLQSLLLEINHSLRQQCTFKCDMDTFLIGCFLIFGIKPFISQYITNELDLHGLNITSLDSDSDSINNYPSCPLAVQIENSHNSTCGYCKAQNLVRKLTCREISLVEYLNDQECPDFHSIEALFDADLGLLRTMIYSKRVQPKKEGGNKDIFTTESHTGPLCALGKHEEKQFPMTPVSEPLVIHEIELTDEYDLFEYETVIKIEDEIPFSNEPAASEEIVDMIVMPVRRVESQLKRSFQDTKNMPRNDTEKSTAEVKKIKVSPIPVIDLS